MALDHPIKMAVQQYLQKAQTLGIELMGITEHVWDMSSVPVEPTAHSAVGLVVDTLRDARRMVEDLQDLALGKSEMGEAGGDTLRTMYPFLDDSRERELLVQYREQLEGAKDVREKAALQNALVRVEAMIAKKDQMKQAFINRLRFLADRATEALEVFEEPGFPGALDQALRSAAGAEEPPTGEERDGGSGAADPGTGAAESGAAEPGGTGEPTA